MTPNGLKDLFARKARALARRPVFARSVAQARARLGAGLACDVEHDGGAVHVDQPESEGGGGTGPHPEQLMRAVLGASLAMSYRLWGARLDVPIDGVDVELTCEYDARGQMGIAPDVPVGWQRIRFDVTVLSAAPESAVRQVVDTADRLSPMLANLSPAIERTHRLTVRRPADLRQPSETAADQRKPSQ